MEELSRWDQCNHKGPLTREGSYLRRVSVRVFLVRMSQWTFLALNMERGASSQGMWAGPWKWETARKPGNYSPPEPSEETQPC